MIKKLVKYEDFNGNTCEEELYFNMTKSELAKMQHSHGKKDYSLYLEEVMKSGDQGAMLEITENFLLASYGIKSEDGSTFKKSAALREEFASSAAYDELFMELLQDANAMEEFVIGVMPANMKQEVYNKVNEINPQDNK